MPKNVPVVSRKNLIVMAIACLVSALLMAATAALIFWPRSAPAKPAKKAKAPPPTVELLRVVCDPPNDQGVQTCYGYSDLADDELEQDVEKILQTAGLQCHKELGCSSKHLDNSHRCKGYFTCSKEDLPPLRLDNPPRHSALKSGN